jgi:hypothetical protein
MRSGVERSEVVAVAVKTIKASEAPLVRIVEVLAEVAGDGDPGAFHAEAERLAETMRAAVTRDWRGHPCLSWVDAERLYLRMLRDRAQLNAEIEERLVEADEARRAAIPRGIPVTEVPEGMTAAMLLMAADPMSGPRRESMVVHALSNPAGALVYHPIGGEE